MANSITTTFLIDGSRNFVAKIDIVCDTAAEYSAQAIIDPKAAISSIQTAAGMNGLPDKFKIRNISWQLTDFYAKLLWDATTDVQAIALNQYEGDIDFFEECGVPLINNAGAGITGKLLITTKGITTTSSGTIIIRGYH